LVVETIGRIRREHLIKGKPIKEIVRELKVSRNTVRKVLRSGATSFEYARAVQPRPKLGAWHGDLDRMLSDNEGRSLRRCMPRLSARASALRYAQRLVAIIAADSRTLTASALPARTWPLILLQLASRRSSDAARPAARRK